MYFLPFNEAQSAEYGDLLCKNKADLNVDVFQSLHINYIEFSFKNKDTL